MHAVRASRIGRGDNALLSELRQHGSAAARIVTFANDDVRGMLATRCGERDVWMRQYQASHGAQRELLPFLGEPAMT